MIEKILRLMNDFIETDKLRHSFYGSVIFIMFSFITSFFITGINTFILSLIFTLIVATLKEMYDSRHSDIHTQDVKDVLFTVLVPLLFTLLATCVMYEG